MKKYEKGFVCKTINGSLILINRLPNKNKRNKYEAYWKCFCGNEWLCEIQSIISKHTRSCGCWRENSVKDPNIIYLSYIYYGIKQRIFNSNNKDYHNYGGRGITMELKWIDNKNKFIEDVIKTIGHRQNNKYKLDRINVNGNYEINNLYWVTNKENCNNKRNNKLITINGQQKTLTQWADVSNIKRRTISNRIKLGWENDRLLEPVQDKNYKTDLTDFSSIYKGIMYRCYNYNCPSYYNYGGKGVFLHKFWKNNYKQFQQDILNSIGPRPSSKHQLDRFPNKIGNYEPGNIRWATSKENCNNKCTNTLIKINGISKTCAEWAEESKLSINIILNRYYKLGWKNEDLLKPVSIKRFNNEEVENIKTLAKQGLSNYKIAKQMNCGRKVIIDIIRNRGAYTLNKEINEKNIKF